MLVGVVPFNGSTVEVRSLFRSHTVHLLPHHAPANHSAAHAFATGAQLHQLPPREGPHFPSFSHPEPPSASRPPRCRGSALPPLLPRNRLEPCAEPRNPAPINTFSRPQRGKRGIPLRPFRAVYRRNGPLSAETNPSRAFPRLGALRRRSAGFVSFGRPCARTSPAANLPAGRTSLPCVIGGVFPVCFGERVCRAFAK